MAIGQLMDYARFVDPPVGRTILLPEEPRPDLIALAKSKGIDVVTPNGEGGT